MTHITLVDGDGVINPLIFSCKKFSYMVITGYTIYNIRHRLWGTWNSLTLLPKVPGVIICYGFSHPAPFKMGLVVMGPAYGIVVLGTSLSHNWSQCMQCLHYFLLLVFYLFHIWYDSYHSRRWGRSYKPLDIFLQKVQLYGHHRLYHLQY